MKLSLHRDIYTGKSNLVPSDFLQSLFVGELIRPSRRIWISSPWIKDITVIDNTARQFGTLVPSWPASHIRLSRFLKLLVERGSSVFVIVNNDPNNEEFLSHIRDIKTEYPDKMRSVKTSKVHEKGIATDNFTLDGSMNFTYSGVNINEEYLSYRCDPIAINERLLILEERWKEVV